jgi:hypothetical protein
MRKNQYTTEESIWTSWAWIVIREFLFIAGLFLLLFFIWFFDHAEEPIPEIIKNIRNLRFPQDYYIFAIVTGAFYLLRLTSLIKGWRNKGRGLPESWGVSGIIHIGKFEITIENDSMLFNKKGFLKSRSWRERKSEFGGIRLSGEYYADDEGGNTFKYIIGLQYVKPSKGIILCKEISSSIEEFISIRRTWKEAARASGLPAVEDYPLGSLWRKVQDLDKPIRNLAKKNRSSFNFKIDSHLPKHTKILQKDEELTIICGRGLLSKTKIIISPTLMKIGRIILPFDEIQHIGPLHHTKLFKSYHALVVASNSEGSFIEGLSIDQKFWLGRLILAGACGNTNIHRIKFQPIIG